MFSITITRSRGGGEGRRKVGGGRGREKGNGERIKKEIEEREDKAGRKSYEAVVTSQEITLR